MTSRESRISKVKKKLRVSRTRLVFSAVLMLTLFIVWGFLISGRLSAQEVISPSMEPTILVGDRLIVRTGTPDDVQRGDIVIVHNRAPHDPFPLIKRVAGIPGDFVVVLDNQVFVNRRPSQGEVTNLGIWPPRDGHMYNLGHEQYFVIGDNRDNSFDSVIFGPVEKNELLGKALFRYYPVGEMGLLGPEK